MTDLERKVLKALKGIPLLSNHIMYGDSVGDDQHYRVLYSVAPYVAAAITAARCSECQEPNGHDDRALRALSAPLPGDPAKETVP